MILSYREAKAANLKRYVTGRACRNGHVAERYVASRACVECDRKLWQRVRPRLDTEVRRIYIRVPKNQPGARIAFLEKRLQAAADAYFASRGGPEEPPGGPGGPGGP
jgi:hypothetical protein